VVRGIVAKMKYNIIITIFEIHNVDDKFFNESTFQIYIDTQRGDTRPS